MNTVGDAAIVPKYFCVARSCSTKQPIVTENKTKHKEVGFFKAAVIFLLKLEVKGLGKIHETRSLLH